MAISWTSVESSNVAAVAWTAEDGGRLHVRFRSGHSGYYAGVPRSVFDDMLQSGSKGQFVHQALKPGYPWVRAS